MWGLPSTANERKLVRWRVEKLSSLAMTRWVAATLVVGDEGHGLEVVEGAGREDPVHHVVEVEHPSLRDRLVLEKRRSVEHVGRGRQIDEVDPDPIVIAGRVAVCAALEGEHVVVVERRELRQAQRAPIPVGGGIRPVVMGPLKGQVAPVAEDTHVGTGFGVRDPTVLHQRLLEADEEEARAGGQRLRAFVPAHAARQGPIDGGVTQGGKGSCLRSVKLSPSRRKASNRGPTRGSSR